jgi:hypothetical protein
MRSAKQIKLAEKIAREQREVITELQGMARDIERCEKNIVLLQSELELVNAKHANRTTTQDDVHYLEDLLACAKRKLGWEKHFGSLQKRTPELMQRVEELVNHPESQPDEPTRNALLASLQSVKNSMERLQGARL